VAWHWEVIWAKEDGQVNVLTSDSSWRTPQEAYEMVKSLSEYVVKALQDLGAVGIVDLEIVYKPDKHYM